MSKSCSIEMFGVLLGAALRLRGRRVGGKERRAFNKTQKTSAWYISIQLSHAPPLRSCRRRFKRPGRRRCLFQPCSLLLSSQKINMNVLADLLPSQSVAAQQCTSSQFLLTILNYESIVRTAKAMINVSRATQHGANVSSRSPVGPPVAAVIL